jgi:hypothetical protein
MAVSNPPKRNNPLNLKTANQSKYSGIDYVDNDGFSVFKNWFYGLIAGMQLLWFYKRQKFSLEKLIYTWSEDNQSYYLNYISSGIGLDGSSIDWKVNEIAPLMVEFETGYQPFNSIVYQFCNILAYAK